MYCKRQMDPRQNKGSEQNMIREINYFDESSKKYIPAVHIDLGEFTKEQIDKILKVFENKQFKLLVWNTDTSYPYYLAAAVYPNECGFKTDYINYLLINMLSLSV